jgi:hypothetical protein
MDAHYTAAAAAPSVAAVPLLHNAPLEFSAAPALRKRLHDLSNTLTGLLGHLELASMTIEDGELDEQSIRAALDAARAAVLAMREVKQGFDQQYPLDRR